MDILVALILLYTIMFVICLNPIFLLALQAHEGSRQRIKRAARAQIDVVRRS
jgi:hypothetical protein